MPCIKVFIASVNLTNQSFVVAGQELIPVPLEDEFLERNSSSVAPPLPPPDIITSVSTLENRNLVPHSQKSTARKQQETSLVRQYNAIRQVVEIPDEEFKTAMNFLETLQTLLADQFPSCQLICYRNWYLQLRNTTQHNELLFFLDHKGKLANNFRYKYLFFINILIYSSYGLLRSVRNYIPRRRLTPN